MFPKRAPFLSFVLLACTDDTPVASDAASVVVPEAGDGQDAATAPDAHVPDVPIEEISIAANGFVFDARAAGPVDGEPVLLLHGFPQTSRSYLSQLAVLGAAGYRAVAPDQRGYSPGARPADVSAYAMLFLVQDLLAMADTLGFRRFHLVGHDWGASVAWATSVLAGDRVQSLTALSVPHAEAFFRAFNAPGSCQAQASQYIATFSAEGAEAMFLASDAAFLRSLYVGISPAEVAARVAFFRDGSALTGGLNWYRANFRSEGARPTLGPTNAPTLYVWSDGEVSVCRDTAELSAEFVTGPYRFEVLSGLNHWLPELGGDRLTALILEQLRAYPLPK
jgi:pimeloyl-ACP methyl ester carboxylesterase